MSTDNTRNINIYDNKVCSYTRDESIFDEPVKINDEYLEDIIRTTTKKLDIIVCSNQGIVDLKITMLASHIEFMVNNVFNKTEKEEFLTYWKSSNPIHKFKALSMIVKYDK